MRVSSEEEFVEALREGKVGIRDEGQVPFSTPGFQVQTWSRLKRRVNFPVEELLKNPHPEQLQRRFEIVWQ
jgi:hypothetical protein